MTYTYALLEVSPLVYGAIKEKLVAAGYEHAIDSDGVIDLHGLGLKENNCITSDSPENILQAAGKLHEAITDAKTKLLFALEGAVQVGYHMRQAQKNYFVAKTGKHELLIESKRLEQAFDRRLAELRDLGVDFSK